MTTENEKELNELKECVRENTRALRGHNGTPGAIAKIDAVADDVKTIMNNHLPHIDKAIETQNLAMKVEMQTQLLLLKTEIMAAMSEKLSARTNNIVKDYILPLVFPIILAVIMIWLGLN